MCCMIDFDIMFMNVQLYMYVWGVGFEVVFVMNNIVVVFFYENFVWENVLIKCFLDGFQIFKGIQIDYFCDYKNIIVFFIVQGVCIGDEMCMLFVFYYLVQCYIFLCLGDASSL